MKLGEITGSGLFDTAVAFPSAKRSKERTAGCFEFEYILSSDATAVIDDARYTLRPDTFLLRKPGQRSWSIFPFKCYYIHFRPEAGCEYTETLLRAPNYFQLIDGSRYRTVLEDLVMHLQSEPYDPHCELVNARLLELFYRIRVDSRKNHKVLETHAKGYDRFISDSLAYMRDRFDEKITLRTLADLTGYTPNYFHSLFTKIMGETPQKYLTGIRISHAKNLLAGTKKSLSEIAYECGFSSQSHFNTQFKKAVLLTPYEYRKSKLSAYYDAYRPDTRRQAPAIFAGPLPHPADSAD